MREFWRVFQEREPAACTRYQRVATLGVEMARLLELPPVSQAAIRGSALMSSLTIPATNAATNPGRRAARSQTWEQELRGWRWVQVSADVVQGLQLSLKASQLTSQRDTPAIEARVLAVAERFEELTAGRSGVLRALRAMRAGNERDHDRQLTDLLWSEAGQAACDKVLRRRGTHSERAIKELEEAARILEQAKTGPALRVRRPAPTRLEEKIVAPSEPPTSTRREAEPRVVQEAREESAGTPERPESTPADPVRGSVPSAVQEPPVAPPEPARPPEREIRSKEAEQRSAERARLLEQVKPGAPEAVRRQAPPPPQEDVAAPVEPATPLEREARPREDEERREDMSKATSSEEGTAKTGHRVGGDSASLGARVAAAERELEAIRTAATRGLGALASIGPAMEELGSLVSRLQTSLLLVQGGEKLAQPGQGQAANDSRSIALRVERSEGDLDTAEVMDALVTLSNLRDLGVREQGPSWAVLQARTEPETDLAILQAKVAGSLTRRLGGADKADGVEVTILEGE